MNGETKSGNETGGVYVFLRKYYINLEQSLNPYFIQ